MNQVRKKPVAQGFILNLCVLAAFFLTVALPASAQIDSLKRIAGSDAAADTTRVKALDDLCYAYLSINPDSAIIMGEEAVALADKIQFKKGAGQSRSDLGLAYYYKGELQKAITLWESASAIREELNDKSGVASTSMKIGAAWFKLGNYEKSLASQMKALSLYEQLKTDFGVALALNNVAAVFEMQKQYNKAREYYFKAVGIHTRNKDSIQAAQVLINIGNIHYRENHFDSAARYWKQALRKMPAGKVPQYESIAYNNLAEHFTVTGKYDSALLLIDRAIALRKATGDYQGLTSSMSNLGRIYALQKKYSLAEKTYAAALDSAEAKNLKIEESKIRLNLYQLYEKTGDFKKALTNYVQYATIEDSLSNERSRKNLDELLVTYETDKKEQEIVGQRAVLASQQALLERTYLIIGALVIIVGLLAVIFLLARGRFKRKQQLAENEKQLAVREAFIDATIRSQENERKRFAQDLHDGMGQLISSLRLMVSQLDKNSSVEDKLSIAARSEGILNDMHTEIRSIAFNLMPQTLIQHGLLPALQEMALRINQTGKINVSVAGFDVPDRLTEVHEISLYRIIQEWVNNVIKYAHATKIEVQLVGHEEEISITVDDNGRGFDPRKLDDSNGNGWKNIKSRINLVKGDVEVDSAPQRNGTSLILRVPVTADQTVSVTR
ncbi:MAG: sensor histidine kinase [Cyclobacteriaceae bacterium]|nr:sensor histidine kinase [Cyclobacteriaceae bacterium]